jgi:hypothetical protein
LLRKALIKEQREAEAHDSGDRSPRNDRGSFRPPAWSRYDADLVRGKIRKARGRDPRWRRSVRFNGVRQRLFGSFFCARPTCAFRTGPVGIGGRRRDRVCGAGPILGDGVNLSVGRLGCNEGRFG